LTFDLLTLKVVSESGVTWATSVPILVLLGLSVLELGLMYVTDIQTDIRQKHGLMPPPYGGDWGRMHKKRATFIFYDVWQKWTNFINFSLLNSERISGKSWN